MAAKDYRICCGMDNAYISKVSKRNPNVMLTDRYEISENDILMLIDWYMDKKCKDSEYSDGVVCFKSHIKNGNIIKMQIITE